MINVSFNAIVSSPSKTSTCARKAEFKCSFSGPGVVIYALKIILTSLKFFKNREQ